MFNAIIWIDGTVIAGQPSDVAKQVVEQQQLP